MRHLRFLSVAILLAMFLLPAYVLRADEAVKAGAAKKMQVLVLVGGHGFPVKPFHEIFANFADMKCTIVEEKVGGEAFENIDNWPYDAMVFYNFEKKPSEKQRENLLKLMDRGVGLVVLHHGLHAYLDWPEYKKITGVTSIVKDSKDDVNFTVHVEDPQHPIVKGLKDFAIKDETYKGNQVDSNVHVILTTDEPTNYKAIAWVHTYRKSPVCYFQLGHGTSIYGQKEFLTVLGNAIRWTAGRLGTAASDAPALMPLPQEMTYGSGKFELKPDTAILVDKDSPDAMNVGKQLAQRLRASTAMDLKVATADSEGKQPGAIRLTTHNADASLGAEGYRLEVSPDAVVIAGGGGAGLFYGMQTLLQLLPPQVFSLSKVQEPVTWAVPTVEIKDQPRFPWRGLLLDVSRHFFNKQEIKNFLDLMAQHKLNTFHLHLVDDNGWRIEIKRYPKLTEEAAWRKGIDFGLNPKDTTAYGKDGRYGGFYTQDDIREMVAYAQARYITIVPEIEMPGHSGAALSVYPEFSCFGGPYSRDGGPMGIYCPGNDAAFEFLQNILTEVIDLFPGKYIHIGADEVDQNNWTKCPKCQSRLKQENLKNEHELQSYFVKRIEKFLNQQGRTLIGWDEILEGGLAPNATVMSWRNIESGIVAANAGHDVVMTPTSHCYLDYYQAKSDEPRGIGGFLPLEQVYRFEPLPAGIPTEKAKHVLGAGGNLWSEYFPNYAHVQYMAYPRACAIAELTWTDPKLKNWQDFKRRLETQFERLKLQGVNYRAPRKQIDPGY